MSAIPAVRRLLGLPFTRSGRQLNLALARIAGKIAQRSSQALYCYYENVPAEPAKDTPLIVFAYHPPFPMEWDLLREDAEAFWGPETKDTFRPQGLKSPSNEIDWSRPDGIVCASSFTRDQLVRFGAPADRITVIPYGFPEHLANKPARQEHHDGPIRFLFVGQGVNRKGLHHLIRAWSQWREVTRFDAQLLIITSGMEPHIAALPRHETIQVKGVQSREALDQAMAESDVFAMPSLVEGFGLVYIEALAAGCHILGSENSGLPDLKPSGNEVTFVRAGSTPDLVAALEETAAKIQSGAIDRTRIKALARSWSQADFRKAIAAHAQGVLTAHEARLASGTAV